MSITSAYEKMKQEGKLNKPIILQQPTPDNPEGRAFGGTGDYEAGIKNIINEKVETQNVSSSDLSELNKLKKRVAFLEESLELIMKQHIKLMNG